MSSSTGTTGNPVGNGSTAKLIAVLRHRAAARTAHWPLTATQQAIWLAEQLDPGESGYHDTADLRLSGPLDVTALEQALTDTLWRHEALRCRIVEVDGEPWQRFDVDRIDWTRSVAASTAFAQVTAADRTVPFDLETGPLWRVRLVRTDDSVHHLVLVVHHLISDGWSHGLILNTLLSCYAARVSGSPAPPPPAPGYGDWLVAKYRREAEVTPAAVEKAARRLAEASRRLALPDLDTAVASRAATVVPVPVSHAERLAFDRAGRRCGITPFMAGAGLFALALARATGVRDIVLAAPVADRSDPSTHAMVGCMVDLLPVRITVDPTGGDATAVSEAIRAGRRAVLEALAYAGVPYRAVARALNAAPGADDPLTNVAFEQFNVTMSTRRIGALTVTPLPRDSLLSRHDLTFSLPHTPDPVPEVVLPAGRWPAGAGTEWAARLAELIRLAGRQ